MAENNPLPKTASQYPRLPCRGCTPDCKNYALCEGTPWRIERDGKVPTGHAATRRS